MVGANRMILAKIGKRFNTNVQEARTTDATTPWFVLCYAGGTTIEQSQNLFLVKYLARLSQVMGYFSSCYSAGLVIGQSLVL